MATGDGVASLGCVDESRYGPGPWVGEPDRMEWRHRGVPCMMVRAIVCGNWCGYAAVPPGHPWHGRDEDDLDVEVHGGLTYGAACRGHICHVPEPGEPDDVWWLGFDCARAWDVMPFTRELRMQLGRSVDSWLSDFAALGMVYRDAAYVRAECERLADQVLAAAAS